MHVHDWVKGGPTNIDNLALGCDYHHHRFGNGHCNAAMGGCGAFRRCGSTQPSDPESIPFHDPDIFTPPD